MYTVLYTSIYSSPENPTLYKHIYKFNIYILYIHVYIIGMQVCIFVFRKCDIGDCPQFPNYVPTQACIYI